MAWAKNGTPETLSGTADAVTISDLGAKKFNVFMTHIIASGACWTDSRINNDSGSLYAQRRSADGATDATATSQALLLQTSWSLTTEAFIITYVVGISGEEKLAIGFAVEGATAGATTAPGRNELVGKYVPSPLTDTIDRFDMVQGSSGDYTTGSNLSALGTD